MALFLEMYCGHTNGSIFRNVLWTVLMALFLEMYCGRTNGSIFRNVLWTY